jgi:uncharacterized protein YbcV (DUF1398 family)
MQGVPLVTGAADIPAFDQNALIKALRVDQAGDSTFPEFLDATWRAGAVRYEVNFSERTVAYQGCSGEEYIEAYPEVEVS